MSRTFAFGDFEAKSLVGTVALEFSVKRPGP